MKAIFTNIFGYDKSAIGIPVLVEQTPIGAITEVNGDTFTCEIWDKYCGFEFFKHGEPVSFYLSNKGQKTVNDFEKCVVCSKPIWEKNLKVCSKCASEYKFE